MTQEELREFAKSLIRKKYHPDYWPNLFARIDNEGIIDDTDKGFYCCQCKKYSSRSQMVLNPDKQVMFVGTPHIVYEHYDGCYGWN